METVISVLRDWQDLSGAIIGAIMAFFVAWYVARDARSREERSAGMIVIASLVRFCAAYESAIQAAKNGRDDDQATMQFGAMFSVYPPMPGPQFAIFARSLFLVHEHLAAHLSHIQVVFEDMEHALRRWVDDQEKFSRSTGGAVPAEARELPRERTDMLMDAKTIRRGGELVVEQAQCVIRFIEFLVLARFPTWNRLRLWLRPSELDRLCIEGLKTGNFEKVGKLRKA